MFKRDIYRLKKNYLPWFLSPLGAGTVGGVNSDGRRQRVNWAREKIINK